MQRHAKAPLRSCCWRFHRAIHRCLWNIWDCYSKAESWDWAGSLWICGICWDKIRGSVDHDDDDDDGGGGGGDGGGDGDGDGDDDDDGDDGDDGGDDDDDDADADAAGAAAAGGGGDERRWWKTMARCDDLMIQWKCRQGVLLFFVFFY